MTDFLLFYMNLFNIVVKQVVILSYFLWIQQFTHTQGSIFKLKIVISLAHIVKGWLPNLSEVTLTL
jgi:hypothetical protein